MRPMREKMHTGELYLPNDDEIFQDQIRKLDRLYDFNMTRPTQLDKRNAERDVCGDWLRLLYRATASRQYGRCICPFWKKCLCQL